MVHNKENERSQGFSGAYPSETIDSCVNICEQIFNAKGDSYVSREEICAIVGKAEGTMIMRIAACVHYGLLLNHHGKGYQITDLLLSVIKPEFESNVRNKKLIAFNNPALYKKLIERYNSKPLPDKRGLANILSELGVHENSSKRAAIIFLENCNDLGINEGGRLRYFISNSEEKTTMPVVDTQIIQQNNDVNTANVTDSFQHKMFKLPIDLGEKTAYLEYPKDITLDEIGELKIMVDAAINALELRKKRNKNPTD